MGGRGTTAVRLCGAFLADRTWLPTFSSALGRRAWPPLMGARAMTSATTTKGRTVEHGRVPLCLAAPLSVLDRSMSAPLSRAGLGHKGNTPLSPLHAYEPRQA
ncbi:hypothetical protein L1887_51551 [Cichorium endivia]|nr:hypothetical protein L1887_51551 [Cichorium endivia]